MFISDTVFCGNDLSMPVSQCTKGKFIILVLNLFPSKSIESPFVLPCYSGTACVKLSRYFMYQYQCSFLLLVFSISFHKTVFYAPRVKTKHSGSSFQNHTFNSYQCFTTYEHLLPKQHSLCSPSKLGCLVLL